MHVTFDFTEIEELMPSQARKQLEAELEKSCCSLGGVCCPYTVIVGSVALIPTIIGCTIRFIPLGSPVKLCLEHFKWLLKVIKEHFVFRPVNKGHVTSPKVVLHSPL